MANQRAPGQTMIGFWADEELAAKIDDARAPLPRSQWLRDVVAEYLISKGYEVSLDEFSAPDRKGKGGPSKFPKNHPSPYVLNESSSASQVGTEIVSSGLAAAEQRAAAKRKPTKKAHPKARAVHPPAMPPTEP